ncbi:MAG TPA: hypothetical protein VFP72_08740 [Kineosporiaceae bacterium]|nr:hypothetical protein [Kineosporiaceae bacterium]
MAVLVTLALVPALFLPRRHEESRLLDDIDPQHRRSSCTEQSIVR